MKLWPGVASTERLLVASGPVTIALKPMLVYSTGVELIFEIANSRADASDPSGSVAHEALTDAVGGLLVQVELADGRRAIGASPPAEATGRWAGARCPSD